MNSVSFETKGIFLPFTNAGKEVVDPAIFLNEEAGSLWRISMDESLFGSRGGFGGPVKA